MSLGDPPPGEWKRLHGGGDAAELRALGLREETLLDFSVNTNPYGPSPAMVKALGEVALDRYPDPTALPAREALAHCLGVSSDRIIIGNGAAELLWTLARILLFGAVAVGGGGVGAGAGAGAGNGNGNGVGAGAGAGNGDGAVDGDGGGSEVGDRVESGTGVGGRVGLAGAGVGTEAEAAEAGAGAVGAAEAGAVGAFMVEPTFCEFRAACMALGAASSPASSQSSPSPPGEWRAREEDQFAVDLPAVAEGARAHRASVIYLCSPNTPTAVALPVPDIARWARANPHFTIILDESFLSLSERASDAAVPMPVNVIRLRSLTKDHGIPGVRVGYAITPPDIAAAVERNRPAWTVNAFAQAACLAACAEQDFIEESRARLLQDRRQLAHALETLSLHPLPSATNFLLVRVGNAADLRARLLHGHGILVRDCASFGLPDFIRLAARPAPDRARLMAALGEVLPLR